jgi:polar amino acid transport system substrate-binding protein
VSPRYSLLLVALLVSGSASAGETLHVCVNIYANNSYTTPDGRGSINDKVARAARALGLQVKFHAVPLARCRADAIANAANAVNAYPMTPFNADMLGFVAYPMRAGLPDPARATAHTRITLYRRRGTAVSWDGQRLLGLQRPVLVAATSVLIRNKLQSIGAPIDHGGQSLQANFNKLLGERGDLAVGYDEEGAALLRRPEYAGKVEALSVPLLEPTYYLAVTKSYYAAHQATIEALWDAIGRSNHGHTTPKP